MSRRRRSNFAGATHHVFNRGASRAPIFLDERDHDTFLRLLARLPGRFRVRLMAYALMPNHYHLVLADPEGNLSTAMKHLLSTYARWFNDRHARDGSPFRGRFANRVVDTEDYLRRVLAYVHANPVRAGLAPSASAAAWTSHRAAIGLDPAPPWLDVGWVRGAFGGPSAYQAFIEEYLATDEPTPDESCPPPETAVLSTPGQAPVCGCSPAVALATVAELAGVPRDRLASTRGRIGQLLAWTLASVTGLTHAQVAAMLGLTRTGVTQRVRRFELWAAADARGAAWKARVQGLGSERSRAA